MTPVPNPLSDTGEQDTIGDEENLSTDELSKLAVTPASELGVKLSIRRHARCCWAKARLRRYAMAAYFLAGAMTVLQISGIWIVRAMVRDTIRATVEQVLKEHKLAGTLPSNAAIVMLTTGGGP